MRSPGRSGRIGHLAGALLCLATGAATGLAAVVVHATTWGWPLAVATAVAATVALPPAWWGRLAFSWAWAATVLGLSVSRDEGDYLISGDLRGYGLLAIAVVLAVAGALGSVRGRARPDTAANTGTVGPSP